ncbi:MAG TPA: MFS transporter [Pyrinomonadaceae bacterium]|jgi:DHA1 family tetracycline resistance protein-like MFS transporter
MRQDNFAEKTDDPQSEKFLTKPLIIIFVTVFIDLIGFGIVIPALPYYVNSETFRATPLDIGWLFASYSLMQFIFSPILGGLSDRYGRRPILFFSLLGSALGYLFIGYAFALWMVFAGRIIAGITGGNLSTAQAYIADVTTRENRAKGMGLFGATFGLGFIFGPAIGGILSRYGIHVPFLFAAALSFVNAILLYFILPETVKKGSFDETEKRRNRVVELFESLRDARFGTLAAIYFFLVTAFSIMTYAFVLYTIFRFGYTAEQNGYIFTFIGALAVIFQGGFFNRLVHKFGENPLTVTGCLMMTAAFFVIPYIAPDFGGLTGLLSVVAVMAIGNAIASPAVSSLASKTSSEKEQGKALGVMQSSASLARAIGPAVGGILLNNALNQVDNTTIQRTFWTAAAIMIVAAFIAIYFARMEQGKILA